MPEHNSTAVKQHPIVVDYDLGDGIYAAVCPVEDDVVVLLNRGALAEREAVQPGFGEKIWLSLVAGTLALGGPVKVTA